MFRRLILMLALGAALVACTPAGGGSGTSTGTETLAPIDSTTPSDALPSEESSASPS